MPFHGFQWKLGSALWASFLLSSWSQSHRTMRIHKFLLPFLLSNDCFLIFLHATCVFKPKWFRDAFPSTSVMWVLLHTHNTEQPLKCPPISFKIASVMFCIWGLLSSSSSCDEGSRWFCHTIWRWHLATSQDAAMELPEGVEFRLKLARTPVNTGFFGLVCGLTLMSKRCEFQLKLFFCGCRFVFRVVPPMPSKTCFHVQPFIGEDVDNTRTLSLQCLFSQNLWELNYFLDLCPSVRLNWTRPTGSKVIGGGKTNTAWVH